MENQETTSEGALRETLEESGSIAVCKQAFSMISIPHINQVHLFYIADLKRDDFHATEESSEVALFDLDNIPWDELAFSSVSRTLTLFIKDHRNESYGFHEDTIYANTDSD